MMLGKFKARKHTDDQPEHAAQDTLPRSVLDEQLAEKYGPLPLKRGRGRGRGLLGQQDRKYFDSGDYALSKAGRAPPTTVGTAIPNPNNIPHLPPRMSISPTTSMSYTVVNSNADTPDAPKPLRSQYVQPRDNDSELSDGLTLTTPEDPAHPEVVIAPEQDEIESSSVETKASDDASEPTSIATAEQTSCAEHTDTGSPAIDVTSHDASAGNTSGVGQ